MDKYYIFGNPRKAMQFEDNFRQKGLRKRLVQILRDKGISDENVLKAIGNIPRHWFFDKAFLESAAYEDKAFPIGSGQTISQPYTVAYQTELLEIKEGEKVLEIGTGSGYQACVLHEMGAWVFTIERQKKLFEKTKKLLQDSPYKSVKFFFGDGFEGLPTFSPFNKILVTAAAPVIPEKLLQQLKIGGYLVIPVDEDGETQRMTRVIKTDENTFETQTFDLFRFVPMLKGKNY